MNWIITGATSGAIAVIAGAFGSHALRERLDPEMLRVFEVGVRYQMYHALALLAVGILAARGLQLQAAGWCFLVGTVFFSGSLYALALGGSKLFGPITPIGGAILIAGWALLAWAARAA